MVSRLFAYVGLARKIGRIASIGVRLEHNLPVALSAHSAFQRYVTILGPSVFGIRMDRKDFTTGAWGPLSQPKQ
jgi:hypothetical protein